MLSKKTLEAITSQTLDYWYNEAKKPEIVAIAQGKEIGHKLADLVDEKTTALLMVNYLTKQERDARGRKRSRSMGDLWLQDAGIYHPLNVKTGIVGAEGRPNLVSLKRVLAAVMAREIDSYYLLMVKMCVDTIPISPSVYLLDMLDWLDYVAFDSGPGQMMLKGETFFTAYDANRPGHLDIKQKVQKLMDLYEDGERRLKENRERALEYYRQEFRDFMSGQELTVTPETQRRLRLA